MILFFRFPCVGISIHALREEGDRSRPWCGSGRSYFYPRPPRGGRHQIRFQERLTTDISIHALREEGDGHDLGAGQGVLISIHALREEGDGCACNYQWPILRFLSTPSARRATGGIVCILIAIEFLSTPSARRATHPREQKRRCRPISIHALREEGDPWPRGIKSLTV